ncbi:Uncharacterized protein HZ326_28423 [Fusarium oxysporum f. sp. albedinis]|nr:Uncharacterized protein HZ326_28423 [Fusarium oxysporum f. sp. albedinis]
MCSTFKPLIRDIKLAQYSICQILGLIFGHPVSRSHFHQYTTLLMSIFDFVLYKLSVVLHSTHGMARKSNHICPTTYYLKSHDYRITSVCYIKCR